MTHGTYVEISAFVCITGDIAVMASNAGIFFAGGGNHFHHPRRRLWRRTDDGHISLEGAGRVSQSRFRGTAITRPSSSFPPRQRQRSHRNRLPLRQNRPCRRRYSR